MLTLFLIPRVVRVFAKRDFNPRQLSEKQLQEEEHPKAD